MYVHTYICSSQTVEKSAEKISGDFCVYHTSMLASFRRSPDAEMQEHLLHLGQVS